jgi:hypothetical protein
MPRQRRVVGQRGRLSAELRRLALEPDDAGLGLGESPALLVDRSLLPDDFLPKPSPLCRGGFGSPGLRLARAQQEPGDDRET